MSKPLRIEKQFEPTGDQPQAIEGLCDGLDSGLMYQTLLGVTGSGKTFTSASSARPSSWRPTRRWRRSCTAR